MTASIPVPASLDIARASAGTPPPAPALDSGGDGETKAKFQEILGELLFGQMLKSMRQTVGKPAYFHGGRGEEAFTQQLDQVLAQKMSRSAGEQFLGPMYEMWSTARR